MAIFEITLSLCDNPFTVCFLASLIDLDLYKMLERTENYIIGVDFAPSSIERHVLGSSLTLEEMFL